MGKKDWIERWADGPWAFKGRHRGNANKVFYYEHGLSGWGREIADAIINIEKFLKQKYPEFNPTLWKPGGENGDEGEPPVLGGG